MSFWSLLENNRCFYCGDSEWDSSGICRSCRIRLRKLVMKKGALCPVCSQPVVSDDPKSCPFCTGLPAGVTRLFSVSYFNGIMKEIVTLYKSGKYPEFRFFLAEIIHGMLESEGLGDSLIIPVPPRKMKIHYTGWDQVDLLCRTLDRQYGKKICRCLERTDRLQQKTLNFHDRKNHMENSLILKKRISGDIYHSRVILLDDVCTSGATLGAATGLLSKINSSDLTALVLSSVI